ncbi:MAG: YeeE/YedE family protein [Alphaproteobacteria bacterium]|nr:YeeE/YedE family protein [Alphaproteobacteria bacterium]
MLEWSDGAIGALIGLAGGVVLGLAARFPRFCTLGAIEDALYGGSLTRLMMWPVALAVAIGTSFLLYDLGFADLTSSVYLRMSFSPVASIAGGLLFGYGMALAGNCGFGALARAGGGDLRSLIIVMVIGISAYMVSVGPLAGLRLALFPRDSIGAEDVAPGIAHMSADALGIAPSIIAYGVAVVFAAVAFADPSFRSEVRMWLWSAVVGLAIASGWLGTTWLAETGFEGVPVESHTYIAPLGESLLYLMTSTGSEVGFSIGSVAGVLIGACLGSLMRGHFRWEACDDPRELRRQILGAFLMGVGGVVALGCSIGQGMSGFSTLALSAPVTAAAIGAGAVVGLRSLVEGRAFRA